MYYVDDYVVVNKGLVLDVNQDNIYVNGLYLDKDNNGLSNYKTKRIPLNRNLYYAVFDGVGGLDKGELASYTSALLLNKYFHCKDVEEIINIINNKIIEINHEKGIKCGTTLTILKITKNRLIVYQVGDSPIYLYANNKLIKINEEHVGNILDNYIGKSKDIVINMKEYKLTKHDKILICSDGIRGAMSDNDVEYLLSSNDDIKYITDKLLNYSLIDGGKDNISIICINIKKRYKKVIIASIIFILIGLIMYNIIK